MFFDEKRAPVDIDYFTKGTTFKGIIELDRVWFVNKVNKQQRLLSAPLFLLLLLHH